MTFWRKEGFDEGKKEKKKEGKLTDATQ